jgi:predicted Zn finger-like uncharacterized protein
MIVECSHCQTKFNLPDDKVKPEGVKIRCTRCKNVFDVSPPMKTSPLADSLSTDLDDDLSGFDEGTDDLSPEGAADSDISEDLDGDIGTDDISLDGDDSDFSLDSDLDIGSEDLKTTDSDSLEFDMTSPEAGADLDRASASATRKDTKAAAESDFTLEEDLNSDLGDLDLSFDDGPAPAGKKATSDAGSDFDLSFGGESAAAGIDSSPIPAARPAAGKTMNDDFGISDDSLLGGKDDLGFGDSIGIDTGHDPFADIEEQVPVTKKKKKTTRRSPLTVALLILLFLAGGGYWVYSTYLSKGFDPEQILSFFSSNEDPLANLENAEMKMHYYYVVNGELGKILVLEGMVVNHSKYEKGRVKVRLTLYDKSGKELGNTESYCGNILDLHELETLPKADIVKLLSVEAGKKLNNAQIKSNESIPYMMVVFSVPESTDGFVVTVVGAQNVGK